MGKRGLEGFKMALDAKLQALVFIGFCMVVFWWCIVVMCCSGVLYEGLCEGLGIPSHAHHDIKPSRIQIM